MARNLSRHMRMLRVLDLRPADLHARPGLADAARWTLRRTLFFGIAAPVALLGMVLLWLPYRLTGALEARAHPLPDVRATYRALAEARETIACTRSPAE